MKCPQCDCESTVAETRLVPGGLRRRRHCACGHRFTTYEQIISSGKRYDEPMVYVPRRLLLEAAEQARKLFANLVDEAAP